MVKSVFGVPPDCGQRLLPAVLDEVAVRDPTRTFISVPRSSNISEGFVDIDYATFAKAVDKFATWLSSHLPKLSEPRAILYLAPVDLRYLLIILGCAKAGHIAFFSSHRNSLEAHKSIAERATCQTVFIPGNASTILNQLLEVRPMTQIPIPTVDYFFQDLDQVEHVPFRLTWDEAKNKTFCILHTSGSTGVPKPVFVSHGTFACNDAHQLIPILGGTPTLVDFLRSKRFFVALPLFHAASLTFTIGYSIFAGVTCVIPPPVPITAGVVNEILNHGRVDAALLAPSLIVDCYNNDEYCVNMVQKLKFLSYVGGALPEEVGNALTSRVKLMTLMGSCETALHPLEIDPDSDNWQYLSISKYLGHSFLECRDGYHELVIKRDHRLQLFQGVFSTFPGKEEFKSGDLFEQHPQKPHLWVFRARTDDIIAFTTAEKLNPITMESVISTNSKVKSALIGGQGKFQAALLIEPHVYPKSATESTQLMAEIWPSVVQANRDCPTHGRIMKGFVMLTDPTKPIPRAGKGTVQRHAALKLYGPEFEALYARMQLKPSMDEAVSHLAMQSQTAMPTAKSASSADHDDLDTRIEAAVARILPGYLEAAVRKVLTQALLGTGQANDQDSMSSLPSDTGIPQHPMVNSGLAQAVVAATNFSSAIIPNPTGNDTHKQQQDPMREIRNLIRHELTEMLDTGKIQLNDTDDLFKFGLDSLQINSLVNTINAYIIKSRRVSEPKLNLVDAKMMYENPTIGYIIASLKGKA